MKTKATAKASRLSDEERAAIRRQAAETAHLLRSPANAKRLMASLDTLRRGEGKSMTVEELRDSVGL